MNRRSEPSLGRWSFLGLGTQSLVSNEAYHLRGEFHRNLAGEFVRHAGLHEGHPPFSLHLEFELATFDILFSPAVPLDERQGSGAQRVPLRGPGTIPLRRKGSPNRSNLGTSDGATSCKTWIKSDFNSSPLCSSARIIPSSMFYPTSVLPTIRSASDCRRK